MDGSVGDYHYPVFSFKGFIVSIWYECMYKTKPCHERYTSSLYPYFKYYKSYTMLMFCVASAILKCVMFFAVNIFVGWLNNVAFAMWMVEKKR